MARMKRAKPAKRTSTPKRSLAQMTVAGYFAAVPQPARTALNRMRATVRSVVPTNATEIISYRIPAFRTAKGVLVWYAAFSDHLSLFPTASVIESFKHELKNFSTSKGTIHFPLDKPLPIALIKKVVRARVAQLNDKKSR